MQICVFYGPSPLGSTQDLLARHLPLLLLDHLLDLDDEHLPHRLLLHLLVLHDFLDDAGDLFKDSVLVLVCVDLLQQAVLTLFDTEVVEPFAERALLQVE